MNENSEAVLQMCFHITVEEQWRLFLRRRRAQLICQARLQL